MFKSSAALAHSSLYLSRFFFNVSTLDHLNLIGRSGIATVYIDVQSLIQNRIPGPAREKIKTVKTETPDARLHQACSKLCEQFTDLFKPELGCLKDVELEVWFKSDFKPIFCKPHTVPFALLEDLNQAYDKGIKKGIWLPTPFQPGDKRTKLRVCGDYSVTVNPHLEMHRHPLLLPEDLVQKHNSAPGNFQEIRGRDIQRPQGSCSLLRQTTSSSVVLMKKSTSRTYSQYKRKGRCYT